MQCTCQDIPDGNLNYLIIRLLKLQSSKNNPQSIMTNGKTLKLLMLVSSYPRDKEDSASVFLRYFAESLSKRGIDVHVLVPADKERGTRIEEGITVHRFQYLPASLQQLAYGSGILPNLNRHPWLWIEVPFFLVMMSYSLLRILRRENPDLVHAHWVLPQGLVALLARLIHKRPVITTSHGGDAFALKGKALSYLKRVVLRKSTAWTSNTQATSEAFGATGSLPKPYIIPMGVEVKQFHTGQQKSLRRELPENEMIVLFVGRLVKKKGVDDLLSAYSLLPSDINCRTRLWIIGDGEWRTRLQQYAETLGIREKTRFWGQISNHRLPDFYAAADLFVAPSIEAASGDTEGQGIVLLEAYASRLCVLSTRVGGISEVVEDGSTGILVEPRNPHQLADAMAKLLGDSRLRDELADNAFIKVKQRYDLQKIAKEFEDLYRALL